MSDIAICRQEIPGPVRVSFSVQVAHRESILSELR